MHYITLLFLLLFLSCNTPEHYKVIGVIKDIDTENNRLLIDHEEIPGFMVKMVMYFNLHKTESINNFTINDSVHFDLIIKDKDSYTINYKNMGKSKIDDFDKEFWKEGEDSKYSLKEPGEFIDDETFLSIDNIEKKISDLTSDLTLITFIFSKCPMPNMCPASIIKNQYLSNHFKDENINFLLISFDYLYDTPRVLKNIYAPIENDKIHFLSSYNHINDIMSITKQSGVGFWGVEENNIGHNMRSILVDKNLKLIKSYDGIDWTAGEAKKDIENLLKFYK